ncbi:MAG: amidohydrolase family protein [Kordiimonadaceae bacterium]|nr:amidohydrolase family protein [Kordiimonadaceae bacterium]MBO6569652.1 amidohydrolase family protein [Kordiimonadaceae bacterium]MBO6966187.1 amidohydrolase family protein [Kordiimonadaceae bacterium]
MRKLISSLALAAAAFTSPAFAEDIAITGGRAFTNGGSGEVENATILVSDGKITSVTSGGSVPDGYRVIDASGKWVTAGFMAADTTLGLSEVALSGGIVDSSAPREKNVIGISVVPAYNPASAFIANTRIEGVTRAMTRMTNTGDMWLGLGAIVKMSDDDAIAAEKAFLAIDLDEGAATEVGGSRAILWHKLNEKFDAAKTKMDKAAESDDDDNKKKDAKKPSAEDAAMNAVLSGDMPIYAIVNRKADIEQLIAFKNRFGVNVILGGAGEAWMLADALAAAGIPVVLDPSANLPGNFDVLGRTSAAAGRLHAAGVKVAFIPPGTPNARLVVQNAGIAVSMGMPWEAAMDALTVNPAEIFGLADSYGKLADGMDADIVVWDGDPIEVMSSPDAVLIAGDEYPLVSRQTKLRDRYKDLDRSPAFDR